ncbi:helix-turn-helix domain-containing protein [Spongiimicrobium salis]|uniref:helix-turn-helix domain-containing protein n=1 Tax=Spongiimicrobium salis TaxID=1667022 RepID=UPI00374CC994
MKLKNLQPVGVKDKLKNKWLMKFTIALIIYLIARVIFTFIAYFVTSLAFFNVHFKILGLIVIIHGLAYLVFLFPEIIQNAPPKKESYKFSKIKKEDANLLKERLLELLTNKKLFLAHDLAPEQVALELGITKDKLSQLLSNTLNTNFYGLINSYRIEEAKRLLDSEAYERAKIIHIAYDSGFSNKSSFLRNFKKRTGQTPSEYRS